MADLRSIAEDIKTTLSSAIADLHNKVRAIATRVDEAEAISHKQTRDIGHLQTAASTHTSALLTMKCHLEDLDNRGRRHNLRIRGMPESIEPSMVEAALNAFFNNLLRNPPETQIPLDWAHSLGCYVNAPSLTPQGISYAG